MPSKSKAKGYRNEIKNRDQWIKAGFECDRVILSGAAAHLGDDFHGDLKLKIGNMRLTVQCKCKADGWKTIYKHLQDHSMLELTADRKPTLCVMEKDVLFQMLTQAALAACNEYNYIDKPLDYPYGSEAA